MSEMITTALAEAQQPFADIRFNLCRLAIEGEDDACILTGTVLDQATLDAALAALQKRLPGARWSSDKVRILRQAQPRTIAVTTNLTNWQRDPSWLGEQQGQVLNGTIIEVLDANERWTFGRLEDGYLGWVYTGYTGPSDGIPEPTHRVAAPLTLLRRDPDTAAPLTGRIFAGTQIAATPHFDDWMEVTLAGGLRGYAPAGEFRPLVEDLDAPARRARLISDAMPYIGVPYLWGGVSIQGIDCSGFAQLMHKLAGVTIPRDADLQFAAGQPVEPPFLPGDLLFYGSPGDHRDISHVAISLGANYAPAGEWRVHSSRAYNGVAIDNVQEIESAQRSFKGARRFI